MRSNGWYRLWILLSLIYLCLIVFYCSIIFPKPEKIGHKYEFYKELSKTSFAMLYNNGNPLLVDMALGNESLSVAMPNGHTMVFSNKFKQADLEGAAKEYWSVIEKKANEERIHLILYAFILWLGPCIALYVLGRGIRWVYQGFKSK